MSLFTRQSGGQRVLPSQDSEDTQQQFSRVHLVQLKPFYRLSTRDVTHVRKCTRPSPALPYCKRREAGRGPGNEATPLPYPHYVQLHTFCVCRNIMSIDVEASVGAPPVDTQHHANYRISSARKLSPNKACLGNQECIRTGG